MTTGTELLACGHDERFGLIGARNGCLACQAEYLEMQVDELTPKKTAMTVITVRMPKALHELCKQAAADAKLSLNRWCVMAIVEKATKDDESDRSDSGRVDEADGRQDMSAG